MNKTILLVLSFFFYIQVYSQDCIGYWNECHNDTINNYHDSYQLVVNDKGQCVSKSAYISDDQSLVTNFDLFPGRDYRITICSTYDYKPIIRLYEIGTDKLVYDNTVYNDTSSIIEFEQRFSIKIKSIVTIPKNNKKLVSSLLKEKPLRYCIGIKIESMITRK